MDCSIRIAETKALISFAVTAKLICVFVFAYAKRWFSHDAAHLYENSETHGVVCPYPGAIYLYIIFPKPLNQIKPNHVCSIVGSGDKPLFNVSGLYVQ